MTRPLYLLNRKHDTYIVHLIKLNHDKYKWFAWWIQSLQLVQAARITSAKDNCAAWSHQSLVATGWAAATSLVCLPRCWASCLIHSSLRFWVQVTHRKAKVTKLKKKKKKSVRVCCLWFGSVFFCLLLALLQRRPTRLQLNPVSFRQRGNLIAVFRRLNSYWMR